MKQSFKDVLDNRASQLLLEQAREEKASQPVTVEKCDCPFHHSGNIFGCSRSASATDYQAVRGF